ncbi:MAG: stage III sporulation protein AD [Clostridia bacterium]|nr:stage III sporulation protein AD [Clostridia bacterium]
MSGTLLVSVVGVLLCAAFLAAVLRTQRPELAVGLSLLAGVLVTVAVVSRLSPLVASLGRLTAQSGLPENSLGLVLRAAGVCLITQLAADTCRDAGESSLASKAELAGRFMLLVMALPLFERVLTLITTVVMG